MSAAVSTSAGAEKAPESAPAARPEEAIIAERGSERAREIGAKVGGLVGGVLATSVDATVAVFTRPGEVLAGIRSFFGGITEAVREKFAESRERAIERSQLHEIRAARTAIEKSGLDAEVKQGLHSRIDTFVRAYRDQYAAAVADGTISVEERRALKETINTNLRSVRGAIGAEILELRKDAAVVSKVEDEKRILEAQAAEIQARLEALNNARAGLEEVRAAQERARLARGEGLDKKIADLVPGARKGAAAAESPATSATEAAPSDEAPTTAA